MIKVYFSKITKFSYQDLIRTLASIEIETGSKVNTGAKYVIFLLTTCISRPCLSRLNGGLSLQV